LGRGSVAVNRRRAPHDSSLLEAKIRSCLELGGGGEVRAGGVVRWAGSCMILLSQRRRAAAASSGEGGVRVRAGGTVVVNQRYSSLRCCIFGCTSTGNRREHGEYFSHSLCVFTWVDSRVVCSRIYYHMVPVAGVVWVAHLVLFVVICPVCVLLVLCSRSTDRRLGELPVKFARRSHHSYLYVWLICL
jgi:hypothetical protein